MEKNQLNQLLTHYSGSSSNEAEGVNELSKQYPYSQVLHVLAARSAKDHNWKNQQSLLQLAAVYSTDRSVLKEIFTAGFIPPSTPVQGLVSGEKEIKSTAPGVIDYADEILIDLERLRELRLNFEATFMGQPESKEAEKKEPQQKEPKPTTKISKRQRLIELAKELEAAEQAAEKKKSSKNNPDIDPLINEIKTTKKKIQPENEKTKEQIELINQFIKSKPTLTPPKPTSEENPDLASTLKSGEFSDHIISETLAEILIRQGKKDKAIEVYKKLIWKFPQKKAYFAAQIEELKK